uniref:Fibronectin leucine rich transmembrane protein 1 n=1 Tax=Gallus gallus TaxID=9031 RepID=A0A8V0X7K0_CHICK
MSSRLTRAPPMAPPPPPPLPWALALLASLWGGAAPCPSVCRCSGRLRLLFLSRNHLSSVPPGLPPALEELRLDDNRIHTIPLRAFEGLPALRRLVLDGNLLANQRMADDTFSRLYNLSELSLGRNALAAPPANLPRARLRRLSLAANAISHVPAGSLSRMRALERLDLSDNNLTTLPRGLFDDLSRLSHLGLRNNPWFCGCNLAWLRDWVRRRAAGGLEVRGLLCQAPARLRGLPVGELRGEMDACGTPAPANGAPGVAVASGARGAGGTPPPPPEPNPHQPKCPSPRGAFTPPGPVVKMGVKRTEMGKNRPRPLSAPPPPHSPPLPNRKINAAVPFGVAWFFAPGARACAKSERVLHERCGLHEGAGLAQGALCGGRVGGSRL